MVLEVSPSRWRLRFCAPRGRDRWAGYRVTSCLLLVMASGAIFGCSADRGAVRDEQRERASGARDAGGSSGSAGVADVDETGGAASGTRTPGEGAADEVTEGVSAESDGDRSVNPSARVLHRGVSPRLLPESRTGADGAWADHFITYTEEPVDQRMARYRRAGFLVSPPEWTVRHDPGLRNGFLYVGPDYLEFCWVEREEAFEEQARVEPYYRSLRDGHRPYGIGFQVRDPEGFRSRLVRAGVEMPEVLLARPSDSADDSPPRWAYGMFPEGMTPGVHSFYLAYLGEDGQRRNERFFVGENGVFLFVGALFVSPTPVGRVRQWSALLDGGADVRTRSAVVHGPHAYVWVSPEGWGRMTGTEFPDSSASVHELTAVIALSYDLARTRRFVESAGIAQSDIEIDLPWLGEREALLIDPDPRDGFPMIVLEGGLTAWKEWRDGVAGSSHRIVRELPDRE